MKTYDQQQNPIDDRPAASIPPEEVSAWPPSMQRIHQLAVENPEVLVLSRFGDFYEAYFENALVVARELDLVVTFRVVRWLVQGEAEAIVGRIRLPLVGIPRHSLQRHTNALLDSGHTVALVDDGPEVHDRRVTRIWHRRDEELFGEES